MFKRRMVFISVCCVILFIALPSHGSEIIDGKEVPPHSLPFMALLKNNEGIPQCGGALISPEWVLTAAHCTGTEWVVLGLHSIDGEENDYQQVREVKSFPHPWYDEDALVNDLMLLKLKKPVEKTKTVNWLKLGQGACDPIAGSKCLVAGWGTTNYTAREMSNVLMAVNVTVVDRETCNSEEYYNHCPTITKSMVCAGSDGKNHADTCQGDSGGPMLCNGQLMGITSFGEGCGDIKKPGVYSFLSPKQLDWIKKTMES